MPIAYPAAIGDQETLTRGLGQVLQDIVLVIDVKYKIRMLFVSRPGGEDSRQATLPQLEFDPRCAFVIELMVDESGVKP